MTARITELLKVHEGEKAQIYYDSVGIPTIGVGFNLDNPGLYPEEIAFVLQNRINKLQAALPTAILVYTSLSDNRKMVLEDMAFNVGVPGLKKFKRFITALERQDYASAADEIIDSEIAPARARRLAAIMALDTWDGR